VFTDQNNKKKMSTTIFKEKQHNQLQILSGAKLLELADLEFWNSLLTIVKKIREYDQYEIKQENTGKCQAKLTGLEKI
jgi:hypothetical protein